MRYPAGPTTLDGLRFWIPDGHRWVFDHNELAWRTVARLSGDAPVGSVVDVGAYVGFTALLAAKAGASVLAVEANPWAFELLVRNIRENGLEDRVRPVQAAVTVNAGFTHLRGHTRYHGAVGLHQPASQPVIGTAVVVSLAGLLAEAGNRVDYLKIDVEGAEHAILAAGVDLRRVRYVSLEPHDTTNTGYHSGEPVADLGKIMRESGFTRTDVENLWVNTGAAA